MGHQAKPRIGLTKAYQRLEIQVMGRHDLETFSIIYSYDSRIEALVANISTSVTNGRVFA